MRLVCRTTISKKPGRGHAWTEAATILTLGLYCFCGPFLSMSLDPFFLSSSQRPRVCLFICDLRLTFRSWTVLERFLNAQGYACLFATFPFSNALEYAYLSSTCNWPSVLARTRIGLPIRNLATCLPLLNICDLPWEHAHLIIQNR